MSGIFYYLQFVRTFGLADMDLNGFKIFTGVFGGICVALVILFVLSHGAYKSGSRYFDRFKGLLVLCFVILGSIGFVALI